MPSKRKLVIYKNVHNVQNFVDNYKNKHFIFKNAESPDKYWIFHFVTVCWQNNYKMLDEIWKSMN